MPAAEPPKPCRICAAIGLNVEQTADFLGVDRKTIGRWLAETRNPLPSRRVKGLRSEEYRIDPAAATWWLIARRLQGRSE